MSDETLSLPDGYSRLKEPPTALYRYMTTEEAKKLTPGQRVPFKSNDGTARLLTINGKPKTWKRDQSRVEVPCKYGMYEFATFKPTESGRLSSGMAFLLVKIEENGD